MVLLKTVDSDMDLSVAVGADSRYGVWMIRVSHLRVGGDGALRGTGPTFLGREPVGGNIRAHRGWFNQRFCCWLRSEAVHHILLGGTVISSSIFVET